MTEPSVPRRTFLAAAAAAAGVAGAAIGASRLARAATAEPVDRGARARARAPERAAVKLGVASYSLRKFPLDKTLAMIKELRTPYVNFKSVHVPYEKSPQELAALRQQIEAAGFHVVGGGTITFSKDTDEDVRRYFEYAKAAGMPTIVGTGAPGVMPRVERFAKEYDIKVAIHNHGTEDTHFPSPYDVLKVVQHMDSRMGLCIDIGHTVRTGTDVVKAVLDAGPRLHDMHVKDLRDLKAKESQCIVGEGALPIADIFRALSTIKYPGYVNLEYEIDADDPLPGMKQSFAYMRGVLAGLAPAGARTASAGG
jgi:sugar phosphate isomerase/epimerase